MDEKVFQDAETKMKKALDALHHELGKMRTGRASVSILDDIRVDYYGTFTPLNQLATLAVSDAKTITIQVWDASSVTAVEKAIQGSGLGLNPNNDGKLIRVPIPSLNEERRKDLVKTAKKHGEECKVGVRNARRDANDELKTLQKNSDITEDEEHKALDKIQKLTNNYIAKIDDLIAHKEKDVMEV